MSEVENKAEIIRADSARKSLCFWVVAPGSAKARRVSVSSSATLCGLGLVAVVISLVGFVLGDYASIQLNRARNYFHLVNVTRERAELLRENSELQSKLQALTSSASRNETIEQGLKARLDELASVVGALKSIDPTLEIPTISDGTSVTQGAGDVASNNKSRTQSPATVTVPGGMARFSEDGIGGAEIECEGNPQACVSLGLSDSNLKLEPASAADTELFPSVNDLQISDLPRSGLAPEMAEALDHYIEMLKALPVSAPAMGRVSSHFGFRHSPFSGGISAHEGVDFSLPSGSHVFATGDGIVKEVRWNSTYGLVVDIEHSPRIVTRYAHLKKAFVAEGERVCRGETIALSGATGRATGPHLHYEVLVDGRARNPDKLMKAGTKLAALF